MLHAFLLCCPFLPAQGPAAAPGTSFLATAAYEERALRGWTLRLHPELLAQPEAAASVLAELDHQLYQVARAVPAAALPRLQRVPIWAEWNDAGVACMCYHVSAEWLAEHGFNPEKAGAIEIGNAANFLAWSREQPWMVLHELAHSWYWQVLQGTDAEVERAYAGALARGSYASVLHANGTSGRHYALTNAGEYFAELSEAWFGVNDFHPFLRAELLQFDPAGAAAIESAWQRAAPTIPAPAPASTPPPAPAQETRSLSPAYRGGVQTFSVHDRALYAAFAERVNQRGTFTRTWAKYLERPGREQLQSVQDRVQRGAQVILQLTGAPEGKRAKDHAVMPADAKQWADQAARVIQDYRDAGIPLYAVSVGNEADLKDHWAGTPEQFYAFYCAAVPALQQRFPDLRIGGPSVARIGGSSFEWWQGLFEACKRGSVHPQYLGLHQYQGFASDLRRFQVATRLRQLYEKTTGRSADFPVILDEWDYAVAVRGAIPALDREEDAANFVVTALSAQAGGFDGHVHFMLQDGSWDSKIDYSGLSCGVFTVSGGPKATFAAMRLLESVVAYGEGEAVTAPDLPWSCAAYVARAADGSRRILVANSPRNDETSPERLLFYEYGLDLSDYKGQTRQIREFFRDRTPFDRTGLPEPERGAWEKAKVLAAEYARLAKQPATVRLQFPAEPGASVSDAVIIDHTRGNPAYGYGDPESSFRMAFDAYQADPSATKLAQMLDHPQAQAEPFDASGSIQLGGKVIEVTIPPHTVIAFSVRP
ncbi:MAG: hypothetical protein EYC70_15375 [Planctomycetota bacterium]|nr:MAG: hypothetical protein EYC70_15375 [Planctomycetota bacterium]